VVVASGAATESEQLGRRAPVRGVTCGVGMCRAVIAWPIVTAVLCTNAFGQGAPAVASEPPRVSYGVEVDINSSYVWRGILVDDRPVVQPTAWVTVAGFTLVPWGSAQLGNRTDGDRLKTGGLVLSYVHEGNTLSIEPELAGYISSGPGAVGDRNTVEGSLTLSHAIGSVRLFTTHSVDLAGYPGAYFGEAGASYQSDIAENAHLALAVNVGWASSRFNRAYLDVDKGALNVMEAHGALTIELSSYLYLQPHVEFDVIVDPRIRESMEASTLTNVGVVVGLDVSKTLWAWRQGRSARVPGHRMD